MNPQTKTVTIEPLSQVGRIIALLSSFSIAWLIFFLATGTKVPAGSGASIWILAAAAYWLLRLLAAPFFSPPKESVGIACAAVLLLAPIDFSKVESFQTELIRLNEWTIVFALMVGFAGLVAMFRPIVSLGKFGDVMYELSRFLGRGEILFSFVVIISVLGFYQSQPGWTSVILGIWTAEITTHPVELALRVFTYLRKAKTIPKPQAVAGSLLRVDAPNIVRVVLAEGNSSWKGNDVHLACLPDGNLTYILPLFIQIQNQEIIGTGLCCPIGNDVRELNTGVGNVCALKEDGLSSRLVSELSGEPKVDKIIGIVVEGSSIGDIQFQVLPTAKLEEGMVIFSHVRGKKIYYQILDASTKEENFQSNPFGVHIGTASQLGSFDEEKGFLNFPWLPDMNQPVFLTATGGDVDQRLGADEFLIGKVPATSFSLPASLHDLVEYHTAVLGMTGKGKTELALDIIRHALDQGSKVFCVDFTGEYRVRLADKNPQSLGLEIQEGTDLAAKLFAVETGTFGAGAEKQALQDFLDAVTPKIDGQIEAFLEDADNNLAIFELAEITNNKATLRTTEIYLSSIMKWARNNRKLKRTLIALEEAHTIIPEAYGSGMDYDSQWVVGRIGQIALQGRKYGVGLLLVSQRTALVSKTILSQCNTYFTYALVDKTSLDYLSGVYSSEHVKIIPNLRFLEFLAFGKGVKSERPIMVKRDFDPKIVEACKALDAVPAAVPVIEPAVAHEQVEAVAEIEEKPPM
ncbi:MAG TPA: DUF87 domain-containing protein [Pyrinomonadaceae bacterium]|nr:DUF87 domain-containing protein [Pyrinomonadaceae bacterium]